MEFKFNSNIFKNRLRIKSACMGTSTTPTRTIQFTGTANIPKKSLQLCEYLHGHFARAKTDSYLG